MLRTMDNPIGLQTSSNPLSPLDCVCLSVCKRSILELLRYCVITKSEDRGRVLLPTHPSQRYWTRQDLSLDLSPLNPVPLAQDLSFPGLGKVSISQPTVDRKTAGEVLAHRFS